jgi:glycosyltransferase involved in cell wall biosynthesis
LLIGKRPKIILIHRADKPFNGYKKILQQLADGCVNAYIFSSKEFGEDWVRSGNIKNPNKIFEIVQASSPFKKKNKIESTQMLAISGDPVYLWVGRLEENKDPRTVVKAFVAFLSVQPSAQLYMIYQTEELLQEIKKIIPEQTDRIHLIGKKEHDALETWYNAADFIISGSHNEAVGIAVAEAMSCGCIPIVTDIISFRKIVGNKGLLYTAGDEKALLQQLINSVKIDSEKLSNEVITHFNNELSFEASAKKIEDLAAVLHDK